MDFWWRESWKTSENSLSNDSWVLSISRRESLLIAVLLTVAPLDIPAKSSLILPTSRSCKPQGTMCWKGVKSGVTLSASPWYVIHRETRIPMAAIFWLPGEKTKTGSNRNGITERTLQFWASSFPKLKAFALFHAHTKHKEWVSHTLRGYGRHVYRRASSNFERERESIPTQTPVKPSSLEALIENVDERTRITTSSSDLRYQWRSILW